MNLGGGTLLPVEHADPDNYEEMCSMVNTNPYLITLPGGQHGELYHNKKVYIFSNFGTSPDPDGQLNSAIKTLLDKLHNQKHLELCTNVAELKNCVPTVLLEKPEKAGGATAIPGIDYGYFLDADSEEVNSQNTYARDALEVQRFFKSKQLYLSHNRAQPKGTAEAATPPYPMYPLPVGRKPSSAPLSKPPDKYMERTQLFENRVCNAIGVPHSMLTADSGLRNKEGFATMDKVFREKLLWYKNRFTVILNELYQHIYGDADAEWVVDRLLNATRFAGAHPELDKTSKASRDRQRAASAKKVSAYTDKDLFDARENSMITLTLEIPGLIDFPTLKEMWMLGIIKDKEFDMLSRLSANITDASGNCGHCEKESGLKMWSNDDKKSLLLGKRESKTDAAGKKPAKKTKKLDNSVKQKSKKKNKEGKPSSSSSSSSSSKK
jgi:hypothetical protein